jgi:hypothetical protein
MDEYSSVRIRRGWWGNAVLWNCVSSFVFM